MMNFDRSVVLANEEYTELVQGRAIADSLLALFEERLNSFYDITRGDIELVCKLYGIKKKEN